MTEKYLIVASLGTLALKIAQGAAILVGASGYDAISLRRQKNISNLADTLLGQKKSSLPKVLVIVITDNNEATIKDCLGSINQSSYKQLKVAVADNASRDSTRTIVKSFSKKRRSTSIQLLEKRQPIKRHSLVKAVLAKVRYGEIVIIVDGNTTIQPDYIRHAAAYLLNDKSIGILKTHHLINPYPSILALMQRFLSLTSFPNKKVQSLYGGAMHNPAETGTIYRRIVLKKLLTFGQAFWPGDKSVLHATKAKFSHQAKYMFASDLCVYGVPTHSYSEFMHNISQQMTTTLQAISASMKAAKKSGNKVFLAKIWRRMVILTYESLFTILEPVMAGYFTYLAFTHKEVSLIAISWLAFSLWLGLIVWTHEHLTLIHKLRLLPYLPIMFVVFFALRLIQLTVAATLLINRLKRAVKRKGTGRASNSRPYDWLANNIH